MRPVRVMSREEARARCRGAVNTAREHAENALTAFLSNWTGVRLAFIYARNVLRGARSRTAGRRNSGAMAAELSREEADETLAMLMHLAAGFEDDDHPLQAIKCYEAIAQSKDKLNVLPLPEAEARVRLSNLLLKYTDNVHRAKTHLETTQLLMRGVHGYEEIKCATFSGLSKCYRLYGDDLKKQQMDAVNGGLDLARVTAKKKPKDDTWVKYQYHFLLERAGIHMRQGGFKDVTATLDEGAALATKNDDARMRCVFALAEFQRALGQRLRGRGAGSGEVVASKAADEAVAALMAKEKDKAAVAHVRLHHHILKTCGKLMAGDVASTQGEAQKIQNVLKLVEDGVATENEYGWLPIPAMITLARLLNAEAARPLGKFSDARKEIELAMKACDGALMVLGVLPEGGDAVAAAEQERAKLEKEAKEKPPAVVASPEPKSPAGGSAKTRASPRKSPRSKPAPAASPAASADQEIELRQWVGSETDLAYRTAADAGPYLFLRMYLLQSLVAIELTSTKLNSAAQRAERMRAMIEAYPRTLRRCAHEADMAEGHVLHSLGKFHDAAVRFSAAADLAEAFGTPAGKDIASVCGALYELADGSPEAISRALDLVRPVLTRHEEMIAAVNANENEKDLGAAPNCVHQAAALFVSGYATLRQGDASQEAKPKLSKALKLAHSQCCNHQLVAQSLSLIGGIVLDARGGDLSQSLDMLQSSFTLSKAQEDMPAQIGCLVSLLKLHKLKGSDKEEQDALRSYHARKAGAYETILKTALEDEDRLKRLTAGAQNVDEEMEPVEEEFDE